MLLRVKSNRVAHKDIIKLCHLKGNDVRHKMALTYLTHGYKKMTEQYEKEAEFVMYKALYDHAHEAKHCQDPDALVKLIKAGVDFKCVNRKLWKCPEVSINLFIIFIILQFFF